MTEREPFAYVEKFHDSEAYFVVVGGHSILPTQSKQDSDYRAFMMNFEFNKRMDEELAKVLDEIIWRMEEEFCSVSIYGDSGTANMVKGMRDRFVGIVKARKEWAKGK